MLVFVPGQVVRAVVVSPVDCGSIILFNGLPGVWGVLQLTVLKDSLLNAAATNRHFICFTHVDFGAVLRLRHGIYSGVVVGIILFILSGLMPDWLRPCILWRGPGTVTLNIDVVSATADAEESIFTPVSAPRVTDKPIVIAILYTVANNRDIVNDFHIASIVAVDATSVVIESLGHRNTASDGTTLVNLLLHVLFTFKRGVFIDAIDVVLVGNEASLTRIAIAALDHGRTDLTIIMATSEVVRASLIGDLIVVHISVCVQGIAAMAAFIFVHRA